MLDHDALPHTGPETREPAAMDGNFSHCEPIISPLNCFSPASVMVTEMSAPRVCKPRVLSITTNMASSLGRMQVWFGEPGEQQDRDAGFLRSFYEQCSVLSAPPEKKARVWGSGTTAGKQII